MWLNKIKLKKGCNGVKHVLMETGIGMTVFSPIFFFSTRLLEAFGLGILLHQIPVSQNTLNYLDCCTMQSWGSERKKTPNLL